MNYKKKYLKYKLKYLTAKKLYGGMEIPHAPPFIIALFDLETKIKKKFRENGLSVFKNALSKFVDKNYSVEEIQKYLINELEITDYSDDNIKLLIENKQIIKEHHERILDIEEETELY